MIVWQWMQTFFDKFVEIGNSLFHIIQNAIAGLLAPLFGLCMDVLTSMLNLIPIPDAIANFQMSPVPAGLSALAFAMGLPQALLIIIAGYSLRIILKIIFKIIPGF